MRKIFLKFSLIVGAALLLCACDRRETIRDFSSLNFLYAVPSYGCDHLPIKISSQNDSLFVQRIRNGRLLDRNHLRFRESTMVTNWRGESTYYFFDEIINGEKAGSFQIPMCVFEHSLHSFDWEETWTHIMHENRSSGDIIPFTVLYSFSAHSVFMYRGKSVLTGGRYCNCDYDCETLVYCCLGFLDFLYSITSSAEIIDNNNPYSRYNAWISDDGNLKIYNTIYQICRRVFTSVEIVQFRYGDIVSPFGEIDWSWRMFNKDSPQTESIKIHTVILNGKTYYLIDRAIRDDWSLTANRGNILQLYSIENGELIKHTLFNTGRRLVADIVIEYQSDRQEAPHKFRFDEQSTTIYVPLIHETTLTGRYLIYRWDGTYFTFRGFTR